MIKNARIVTDNADPRDYHRQEAERGSPEFVMSNSQLHTFSECPARWKAGYNPPGSDAKDWGSLLDTTFLTPDKAASRYVVQPATYVNEDGEKKPWNNNAKVCQQWKKEQGAREVVTAEQEARVLMACNRLYEDETIVSFLKASRKQVWLVGEWHTTAMHRAPSISRVGLDLIIPVKALVDMAPEAESEFSSCLGDLKSTRNAALLPWQRWCYSARYHWQAALYLDLWNAATGEERNTFCFVLQENYPPWQTAKRILSQDFIALGRAEYRQAMALYAECLSLGKWPGYDDTDETAQGWGIVAPEPWMAERAQFAPRFEMATEDAAPLPAEEGELIP